MHYKHGDPLLGFYNTYGGEWIATTDQSCLLSMSCDETIVCDSLAEAVRVLTRSHLAPHPFSEFPGVVMMTWKGDSSYFCTPKIILSPIPLADDLETEDAKKVILRCGYVGMGDEEDAEDLRRSFPPEEGFVVCSDKWVSDHLGHAPEDYPGRVIRFDQGAAKALLARLNSPKNGSSRDALLVADVYALLDSVYCDVHNSIPSCGMHYNFRVHGMGPHLSYLETLITVHEDIFGKNKWRLVKGYDYFIWRCYSTWKRTKKKWSEHHKHFADWVESEFRCKKGREVISKGRNGNEPSASGRWTDRGSCTRVRGSTFSFRQEPKKVKAPKEKQLRLKFPRERRASATVTD